ncbi:pyrroline-5-carboxylate reductase [Mesobacillus harenae]|uniref:pyrroline-5-carboxylate reductase n=1 Tax=Mesobacillus harenae TaxID=2213203 RepID=UPI00157FE8CE|nr:pyrroline-5-carboxylate reductase [Mesobacillus harenae]
MLQNKTIAFLGAGSMAEAMISGIVNSELVAPEHIIASNKSNHVRLTELETKYGIRGITRDELNFDEIDVIFLAMKPKDAEFALLSLKEDLHQDHLVLSVLAGISTSFMENNLSAGQQVIRVMPNTSSMIGESATALSPGKHTTQSNIKIAQELLKCIGEVFIIEEDKMDIFTGIAGSGPAYFYYLMEHMEQAGLSGGLDEETTRQIIAQTIVGAARMIQEQDETPTVLRENVTSPNGTTAAGLDALSKHGGGKAISQAIKQAANRSKEISSQQEEKHIKQLQAI